MSIYESEFSGVCLADTSRLALLGEYKHTPNKTEPKKQKKKRTLLELKNKLRRRAKWGFALSRLRKHPLSR